MTGKPATMRRLAFTAPGRAEIQTVPRPVGGEGLSLVAPAYVGICATDLELRDGTHPYFAQGVARYPLQPGHEWSGTVVDSPDPALPPGTRVVADPEVSCDRADCPFCTVGRTPWCPDRCEIGCRGGLDGGAAELVAMPTRNLRVVADSISLRDAVLAEPAVTVLGGLLRLGRIDGAPVLVVGAGTLGLIATQILRHRGESVTVAVRRANRGGSLQGVPTIVTGEDGAAPSARFPVVIVAAGTPSALGVGLAALANGGRLALLGVPGEAVDGLDVASILHKDATIHGVLNSSTGGPALFGQCLDLLADGVVDGDAIVDRLYPLADAEAALARSADSSRPRPKVMLEVAA
jgi:threonine dehydrogenase-like Zn-dependent dehydrogenase